MTGWTCSGAETVTAPVHGGARALRATPQGNDLARCEQAVTVLPNTVYELSAWVQGAYVFLGATGSGVSASTWASPGAAWSQLRTSFTTGPATTSVTVYVNGWYGQGPYLADDVQLDGPGGGPEDTQAPCRPRERHRRPRDREQPRRDLVALIGRRRRDEIRGLQERRRPPPPVTGTSYTATGLTPRTSYAFRVRACDAAGNCSPYSTQVTGTTAEGGGDTSLPERVMVGYLHASFANGSGYIRMSDVPDEWDVIHLAFGEPTSVTSGDIRFTRCPAAECPGVESESDFIAAIRAKQAQGKKVLISIGGQNGQVQLTTAAARDAFVSSVSAIIDRYGLDGLDIDFEGHSLYLDPGDTDLARPTTPVVVNLIAALKTLRSRYGDDFTLTMAPRDVLRPARPPVLRPGPERRRPQERVLPARHPRPARRPDPAPRAGLQLGPDHGARRPVPHDGRARLPRRHDRHAARRLPDRGEPGQHVPAAAPGPGGDRAARLAQRRQRVHHCGRGAQGVRLPGQGHRLRVVPAARRLSRPARADGLVDQLGRLQRQGVLPEPPGPPRRAHRTLTSWVGLIGMPRPGGR
ncbi:glycosyl hydrolase family 18 protein [Nonomuraea salmonea]|uniref:glycosyl hydrolase family 18 protein n=1 Tax=Nonomuraea salmonea TaxID=46181 RepID=UPI0031EEC0E7